MADRIVTETLLALGLEPHAAEGERVNLDRLYDAVRDNCRPCMHAAIFGHWGNPLHKEIGALTHCRRCHRSWRSIKEAHCTVCCTQFASNEAASYHWVDDEHIDPLTVKRAKNVGGGPRYFTIETDFGPVLALQRHVDYREGTS